MKLIAIAATVILIVGIVVGAVFGGKSRTSSESPADTTASSGSASGSPLATGTSGSPEVVNRGKPYLAVATVETDQLLGGYYLYIFHQLVSSNEIRFNRAAGVNFTWNRPREETVPLASRPRQELRWR